MYTSKIKKEQAEIAQLELGKRIAPKKTNEAVLEKIKNHQASFKLNTDSLKEFKKQIRRSIKKQITANFIAINKSEIAINKNLFLSKKLNAAFLN